MAEIYFVALKKLPVQAPSPGGVKFVTQISPLLNLFHYLIFFLFQFMLGILCALFGFLIFLSLLLTSIDKAMHSLGPKSGYILQVRYH